MHSVKDMALGALVVTAVVFGYQLLSEQTGFRTAASRVVASAIMASPVATATSQTNIGQTNNTPSDQPDTQTYFEYKLVFDVDPCTLTTLGKANWEPIEFGKDINSGDDLHLAAGKDTSCQHFRDYSDFIWILFKRSTTTTSS